MNALTETFARWLADYYLLASLLRATALGLSWCIAQPTRRVAVTRATLAGLVLLAILCALPGWSVVHLMTREASPAAIDRPVIEREIAAVEATPVEAPAEATPLPEVPASVSPPAAIPAGGTMRLSDLVVWAYFAASLLVISWQLLGNWRARALVRQARPAPPELQRMLVEIAGAAASFPPPPSAGEGLGEGAKRVPGSAPTPTLPLGGRESGPLPLRGRARVGVLASQTTPRLLISSTLPTAVALGILRPTILLPQRLVDSADATTLQTILAHELAHIRHGDLRLLALCRGLFVLLWANPLFWLLRRRLRLDQETLADAAAAQVTTRHAYAAQLIDWAKRFATERPPALAAAVGLWESPSQLRHRIAVLLDERLTIWRECSYAWRAASNCLTFSIAIGLSLITLGAPQAEPSEYDQSSVFQLGMERHGVLRARVIAAQPVVTWQFDSVPEPGTTHRPALGQLAVSDEMIYGSDGFGRLFAIEAPTGQRKWMLETGVFGETQQPVIDGDAVYYASSDGVTVLSAKSGGFLWRYDIPLGGAAENSPLLIGDRLFVTGYDGLMRALNAETGELLWQCDLLEDAPEVAKGDKGQDARFAEIKARPCVPASDGKTIYQPIFDQMRLVAVDSESGRIRWSFETDGWMKGNPVVDDGHVYFGSQDQHFYCVNTETGKEVWKFRTSSRVEAGAALLDGKLYFGCCAGIVYCVDSKTGTEIWRFSLDKTNGRSFIYCSPLITRDGDLYIGGMEGQVYCLDTQSGQLRWKIRPSEGSEIDSHLATDGQRLFITTRTVNDNNLETGEVAIFALDSTEKQSERSDSTSSTVRQDGNAAANVATANTPVDTPSVNSQPNTITGRYVDEQGQPLRGVTVAMYRRDAADRQVKLVREVMTGADGKFGFENAVDLAHEFAEGPEQVASDDSILIAASAPDRATNEFRQSVTRVAFGGHAREIPMPPAAKLTGRVTGPEGEPIDGVHVSAIGHRPSAQRLLPRWIRLLFQHNE